MNGLPELIGLPRAKRSAAKGVADWFASVKVAVLVVAIIAAACVAGTLLPQGADAMGYVEKNPGAAARFALFGRLGLTHVFSSAWFIGLLCALAVTMVACSARRL